MHEGIKIQAYVKKSMMTRFKHLLHVGEWRIVLKKLLTQATGQLSINTR